MVIYRNKKNEFIRVDGGSNGQSLKKFSTSITGDGVKTVFNIEHNLDTEDIIFEMNDGTEPCLIDYIIVDNNNIAITFAVAPNTLEKFYIKIYGVSKVKENNPSSNTGSSGSGVNTPKIVSWADGTDEEIVAMVEAAKDGIIDLYDYWKVGDERKIEILGLETSFVLLHKGLYELVTPAKNTEGNIRKEVSFIVGTKNAFANSVAMNLTDTNTGSWDSSNARYWCNNDFKNKIPESLLPIFAQFKTVTVSEYNSNVLQTSYDYFAFPAEKEVIGTKEFSNNNESNNLKQFEYYASDKSNRILNTTDFGIINSTWWLRSPDSNNPNNFCNIDTKGNATTSPASYTSNVAVIGCIN